MSIYISKGYETNQLTLIKSDEDDFKTIVNSKVKTFKDVSTLDDVKRKEAYYFIAGELSKPVRSNDNILNKTLVTLDYDDLEMTEKEFREHLMKKINALKFYAYPSISNQLKDTFKTHLVNKINALKFYAYPSISNQLKGTRYRLIIPTDRPYTKEESTKVIQFVTDHIGLPYDKASEVFSQLQGLKTTFESIESFESKCILNEGKGVLKVDNALQKMEEREPSKKQQVYFKTDFTNKKKFTASFMEELMQGVDEGNRDNWLTKQYGRMLSLGFDYVSSYEWLELINREFVRPPLDQKDLNRIVLSIANKEKRKYSNAREG